MLDTLVSLCVTEKKKDLQWKHQSTPEAQEEAEKLQEIRAQREKGEALREAHLEGTPDTLAVIYWTTCIKFGFPGSFRERKKEEGCPRASGSASSQETTTWKKRKKGKEALIQPYAGTSANEQFFF